MTVGVLVSVILWGMAYTLVLIGTQFSIGLLVISPIRNRLPVFLQLLLALVFGMVIWTLQGYVFGYLGLRWLSTLYVALCAGIVFWQRKLIVASVLRGVRAIRTASVPLVGLIFLGVCLQSVQMVGSGLQRSEGVPFYRVHAQDGIFHLSLIASIRRSFPPIEPGAAMLPVENYHYWSDLYIAEVSRVFNIPIAPLFFVYLPILISVLTAVALLGLIETLRGSLDDPYLQTWKIFAVFLLFFGADLSYLIMLILHGYPGFYTTAIDNGATQFLNMPHGFAKLIFFATMTVFLRWRHERTVGYLPLVVLGTAVLFGTKVYFGLLQVLCIGFYALFELWQLQKSRSPHRFAVVSAYGVTMGLIVILTAAIYLPVNRGAGGLAWYPLEWPKLILSSENLDWKELRYRIAIATYQRLTFKLVLYQLLSVFVSIVCIHGMRMLGLLCGIWSSRLDKAFVYSAIASSLVFTVLGFTTLQESGGFNVFNFFAASIALLALLTAFLLASWWQQKHWILRIVVGVLCLINVPRIAYETGKILNSYRHHHDVVWVNTDELDALAYVRELAPKDAIVQSHPDNALDYHTPYVSYFSDRVSYVAGVGVLETHNQPTRQRVESLKEVFASSNPEVFVAGLRSLGINYVYRKKGERLPELEHTAGITVVYTNASVSVYKVE